ncbi:hypothetical protein H4218_003129 [Coemansia sp. IMI 209128]|uniref:Restriction endonuclease type IV Mrr domain-containing protein n=1 Tax=Coemansia spiralis TaxID=417178 RepID=A0A9W8L3A3_9FUNG|nr:hypothetical protein IWW39_004509 [Coemansia spiralis]KAJ2698716.1 hypothetical protein H4218_003129 [Coemansia sp. IMI 209128]
MFRPLTVAAPRIRFSRFISTVESGTAYENHTISIFNRLGASLERTGGAGDNGVDFRGPWTLPDQQQFYLVGQCKYYERKKIGPSVIREWEGVMSRQELDTLGVVAASSGFTPACIQEALSSIYPIALVAIDGGDMSNQCTNVEEAIRGFVWNKAADTFIGKLVVAKKHYDLCKLDQADPAMYTIQLLWNGQPLPPSISK